MSKQFIETEACENCHAKARIYEDGRRELVVPALHKLTSLVRVALEKRVLVR